MRPDETAEFDLFVSYAADDKQWVDRHLIDVLNGAGIRFHTEATFTLGVPRITEFERAVRNSRYTLLVLSPAYLAGDYGSFVQVLAQSYGAQRFSWPVIPMLLREVELPPSLQMLAGLDATNPEAWQEAASRLRAQLGRPLRVCFVSSEYPPRMVGGLGAHVEQLITALGAHIDVQVVLPSVGSDMDEYQRPPSPRVQLKHLTNCDPSYNDLVSWFRFATDAVNEITHMIRQGITFDAIHCHDWVTVMAGIRCRLLHDIPLVFHVHLPNRTPLCASVENLGLAYADLITVSSDDTRRELLRRAQALGLNPEPIIRIVKNGVDLDAFRPGNGGSAEDDYILFVGRIVQQKGLQYLLRAFYYVAQKFPGIRLKIVGRGDLQPQLERLCRNLLLPERRVEFVDPSPWLTRAELAKLYQGARVVVVPSIYEPFGMTALEALACQRPVVASRIGGLQETIRHKETGVLAEPQNELDLAQWIMALLSDPALCDRLGAAGRAALEAAPDTTWPQIAQQVIRLYRSVELTEVSSKVNGIRDQLRSAVQTVAPGYYRYSSWEFESLLDSY